MWFIQIMYPSSNFFATRIFENTKPFSWQPNYQQVKEKNFKRPGEYPLAYIDVLQRILMYGIAIAKNGVKIN